MVSRQREQEIARERIDLLFEEAQDRVEHRPALSERYMEIARSIATTYTVTFTREQREQYCRECGAYLSPGVTATVRVDDGEKRVVCDDCGSVTRFPYSE